MVENPATVFMIFLKASQCGFDDEGGGSWVQVNSGPGDFGTNLLIQDLMDLMMCVIKLKQNEFCHCDCVYMHS